MNKKNVSGELLEFAGTFPNIHSSCFIASGARLIGNVHLGEGVSVWFNSVLRGDISRIHVGRFTNIQDLCLLHVDREQPCEVGEYCVVGHMAILHACSVGNYCLIGMGARILSGATVGDGCIVAAGAVVLEGKEIPPNTLVAGVPAKLIRSVSKKEVDGIKDWARRYNELAQQYLNSPQEVP